MSKSPDAFRTISEVAEWLDTPAHVLRFWESRFRQVKPVKRAGGRRYYRPADMALLGGIKRLLHEDGMTIKGVQKILRDKGIKHVSSLSIDVDADIEQADIDAAEARLMASIEPAQNAEDATQDAPVATPDEASSKKDTQVQVEPEPQPDTVNDVVPEETTPDAGTEQPSIPVAATDPSDEPVQLDLLGASQPDDVQVIEPAPATESVAAENDAQPDQNAHTDETSLPETTQEQGEVDDGTPSAPPQPAPIECDVPDDPTDEALVVDGSAGLTAIVGLISAEAADFGGKTASLRALLDRISGADGNLSDGV